MISIPEETLVGGVGATGGYRAGTGKKGGAMVGMTGQGGVRAR